jgi:hypothetical protein
MVIAENPNRWFDSLKERGAHGIRMSWHHSRDLGISGRLMSACFSGDEVGLLKVLHSDGRSSVWRSRWEVWDRNAAEQRIGRVTYGQVGKEKTRPTVVPELASLRDDFLDILRQIEAFSRRQNCGGFTERFGRAIDALTTRSESSHGYHRDLAPDGILTDEAARILDACQHAWVFGGMGSWNDLAFDGDDGRVYAEVSGRLFRLLNQAVPAAANNSFSNLNA